MAKYIFIEIYLHSEEGMGAVEKFFFIQSYKKKKGRKIKCLNEMEKKELNKQK